MGDDLDEELRRDAGEGELHVRRAAGRERARALAAHRRRQRRVSGGVARALAGVVRGEPPAEERRRREDRRHRGHPPRGEGAREEGQRVSRAALHHALEEHVDGAVAPEPEGGPLVAVVAAAARFIRHQGGLSTRRPPPGLPQHLRLEAAAAHRAGEPGVARAPACARRRGGRSSPRVRTTVASTASSASPAYAAKTAASLARAHRSLSSVIGSSRTRLPVAW